MRVHVVDPWPLRRQEAQEVDGRSLPPHVPQEPGHASRRVCTSYASRTTGKGELTSLPKPAEPLIAAQDATVLPDRRCSAVSPPASSALLRLRLQAQVLVSAVRSQVLRHWLQDDARRQSLRAAVIAVVWLDVLRFDLLLLSLHALPAFCRA